MSMKELDINLDILYNKYKDGRKNFPTIDIKYNEREAIKTKLLNDYVEVIDKCNSSTSYCKGEDIIFCRLLKNIFGFKKDDYIILLFADDKDFYEEDECYDGCDVFDILYIKNKEQLSDFENNNNLWKQKKWNNPKNNKNYYNVKRINIKIKCKLVLEYEEN
jgi:hypothetical protein